MVQTGCERQLLTYLLKLLEEEFVTLYLLIVVRVLLKEEEDRLYEYLLEMAEMGYGLNRETVMKLAFTIAEKTGKAHPFTGKTAGRAWFDGFRKRYPRLTIRTPQPLSQTRALAGNPGVISDFFRKTWRFIWSTQFTIKTDVNI